MKESKAVMAAVTDGDREQRRRLPPPIHLHRGFAHILMRGEELIQDVGFLWEKVGVQSQQDADFHINATSDAFIPYGPSNHRLKGAH